MEERKLIVKLIEENANLHASNDAYYETLNELHSKIIRMDETIDALKDRCEKAYELGKENMRKEFTDTLKQAYQNGYKEGKDSGLNVNKELFENQSRIIIGWKKHAGDLAKDFSELSKVNDKLKDEYTHISKLHQIEMDVRESYEKRISELKEENSKVFEMGKKHIVDLVVNECNRCIDVSIKLNATTNYVEIGKRTAFQQVIDILKRDGDKV